jgi:hypothetical protein
MSKTLDAAIRNAARIEATLAKRKERQAASATREALRQERAQDAVRKAQERLERVRQKAQERAAKHAAAVRATEERLQGARLRAESLRQQEQERAARPKPSAGTLTTATGESRSVSREAIVVVRKALGRRRHGLLAPLDGGPAQSVLEALDSNGNVGDAFSLSIKGRKSVIKFVVTAEGLTFQSESAALAVA